MEFLDHFGDLHKVDPEFRKVWGLAQQIFDKHPIPDLVQQAREFRIVRCPMTVPVSNHPNAQHQSHIAGPHSDDQIVAERQDCARHILEAKQQIFPRASAIDRESPDLVAAPCKHILEDALAYSTIAHRKRFASMENFLLKMIKFRLMNLALLRLMNLALLSYCYQVQEST